jgi:hypothetical protein
MTHYWSFDTHISLFQKQIFWPYLVDSDQFGHQECIFRKKLLYLKWGKTWLVNKSSILFNFLIYMKYNQNLKKGKNHSSLNTSFSQ